MVILNTGTLYKRSVKNDAPVCKRDGNNIFVSGLDMPWYGLIVSIPPSTTKHNFNIIEIGYSSKKDVISNSYLKLKKIIH